MATNYTRGRAFEYRTRDALKKRGAAYVMRAAQSKGIADLLALFPPATEWAWAAGIYDGEGSTVVNTATSGKRSASDYKWEGFLLSMSQKDIRPLQRLQALVGGRISDYREDSGVHQWRLSGEAGKLVAAGLWPYLSEPKREQIARVLTHLGQELPAPPLVGALLVQCKYSIHGGGHLPSKDAIELVALAELTGALPVFARPGPKGRGVEFTNLYSREIIV